METGGYSLETLVALQVLLLNLHSLTLKFLEFLWAKWRIRRILSRREEWFGV